MRLNAGAVARGEDLAARQRKGWRFWFSLPCESPVCACATAAVASITRATVQQARGRHKQAEAKDSDELGIGRQRTPARGGMLRQIVQPYLANLARAVVTRSRVIDDPVRVLRIEERSANEHHEVIGLLLRRADGSRAGRRAAARRHPG